MVRRLRTGDTDTVSTKVACPPDRLWELVGDPARYPELSPECFRVRWRDGATGPEVGARFRGWNRNRAAVWWTTCRVDAYEPGHLISFTMITTGATTRWTWGVEPGSDTGTSTLRESFEMVQDLPAYAVWFEVLAMGVTDRAVSLRGNLETSVARVKERAERA